MNMAREPELPKSRSRLISFEVVLERKVILVRNFPENMTVGQLVVTLRDEHPTVFRHNYVVEAYDPNDEQAQLSPNSTLASIGVGDGGRIHFKVTWFALGMASDVASYVASAIAGGVVGNAAYDAIKASVLSSAQKWQDRASLNEQSATNVAKLAIGIRFQIAQPAQLLVLECRRTSKFWTRPANWLIRLAASNTVIPEGLVIEAIVTNPDPRTVQIVFAPSA